MISTALLKTALRIDGTDQDDYLTELEAAAVGFVQRYTDRYFGASESVTRSLRGDDTPVLWLPDHAASSGIAVTEREYPGDTGTTITAGDDDGYVTDRPSSLDSDKVAALVRSGGHVWERAHEYDVTFTRGYAAGSEPADIRQAVIALVAWWYEQRTPVAMGTIVPVAPLHVEDALHPWRKPTWA